MAGKSDAHSQPTQKEWHGEVVALPGGEFRTCPQSATQSGDPQSHVPFTNCNKTAEVGSQNELDIVITGNQAARCPSLSVAIKGSGRGPKIGETPFVDACTSADGLLARKISSRSNTGLLHLRGQRPLAFRCPLEVKM